MRSTTLSALPKSLDFGVALGSPVSFKGLLPNDSEPGQSQSVMYDGSFGAGGFLAQILVHAAVAEGVQNSAAQKVQQEADQVLVEYHDQIEKLTGSALLQGALTAWPLVGVSATVNQGHSYNDEYIAVEILPVFYISQDKNSIVLNQHIKATLSSDPKKVIYENVARAVSTPKKENSVDTVWGNLEAAMLPEITQDLFSSTILLLVKDLYQYLNDAEEEKTYKYYIGRKRHYARAKLISEDCFGRALRSLKGNILIFPKTNSEMKSCKAFTDTGVKVGDAGI